MIVSWVGNNSCGCSSQCRLATKAGTRSTKTIKTDLVLHSQLFGPSLEAYLVLPFHDSKNMNLSQLWGSITVLEPWSDSTSGGHTWYTGDASRHELMYELWTMQLHTTCWPSLSPLVTGPSWSTTPSLYTEHGILWCGTSLWPRWVTCSGHDPSQLPVQFLTSRA